MIAFVIKSIKNVWLIGLVVILATGSTATAFALSDTVATAGGGSGAVTLHFFKKLGSEFKSANDAQVAKDGKN